MAEKAEKRRIYHKNYMRHIRENPERLRDYKERMHKKSQKEWAARKDDQSFKEIRAKNWQDWLQKKWDGAFAIYGRKCSCCGVDEPLFLCLHHKHLDGHVDRKLESYYGCLRDAVQNPNPEKYEMLCYNCHRAIHANNGVCPHRNRGKEDV